MPWSAETNQIAHVESAAGPSGGLRQSSAITPRSMGRVKWPRPTRSAAAQGAWWRPATSISPGKRFAAASPVASCGGHMEGLWSRVPHLANDSVDTHSDRLSGDRPTTPPLGCDDLVTDRGGRPTWLPRRCGRPPPDQRCLASPPASANRLRPCSEPNHASRTRRGAPAELRRAERALSRWPSRAPGCSWRP